MAAIKRIIGIDPGLVHTGWGVIDAAGNERKYVASGVILPKTKDELSARLAFIFGGLCEVIDLWKPSECAIEITFSNKNPKTTLLLGHARAAALLAAAIKGLPVFEYEPNKIKKAVSAAGHADKTQIDRMVRIFLPTARPKSPDESDALAIALTRANRAGFQF